MKILEILRRAEFQPDHVKYTADKYFDRPPEEEVKVFYGDNRIDYGISRRLSEGFEPVEENVIDLVDFQGPGKTRKGVESLAFRSTVPCRLEEYKKEEGYLDKRCVPGGSGVSAGYSDVYFGSDGQYIESTFKKVGDELGKYYSSILRSYHKKDDNRIGATVHHEIKADGSITTDKNVVFKDSHNIQEYVKWKKANECEKHRKFVKGGGSHYKKSYDENTYCFQTEYLGNGAYRIFTDRIKYVKSQVGKPNPIGYTPLISKVRIDDNNNNGEADKVKVELYNKRAGLEVNARSAYTASVLEYFDDFLEDVEPTEYSIRLFTTPHKVHVEKGQTVAAGEPLFDYYSVEGIKTFVMPEAGVINSSYQSEDHLWIMIDVLEHHSPLNDFINRLFSSR